MGGNFTFTHIADCHLGAWRDDKMRQLGFDSFAYAIEQSIERKVDFVLIAGDLFNTALPAFDILRDTFALFRKLKHAGIPMYFIAGSHDYSTAGKTMLHLIEEAELGVNVLKGDVVDGKLQLQMIIDPKTGVKLCGILGRAVGLEKSYYNMLDRESLEQVSGPKIFLFHTAIAELKPDDIGSQSTQLSYLPKGFNYYAGGHVHFRYNQDVENYGRIVYPGPTFPNSFSEIEDLHCGSFVFVTMDNGLCSVEPQLIELKKHTEITISCHDKTPEFVNIQLAEMSCDKDSIVTIRVKGKLDGQLQDIDFNTHIFRLYEMGAYMVMKNTAGIEVDEFVAIDISSDEEIEDKILTENCTKTILDSPEKDLVIQLMRDLHTTRQDGEVVADFEERILTESENTLK